MSTVTLSKPHCAITSAENPEGIASQAFTTALPEAQTFFTLFATFVFLPCCSELRHCEEPTGPAFGGPDDKLRDEAIHFSAKKLDCFAALAMTMPITPSPSGYSPRPRRPRGRCLLSPPRYRQARAPRSWCAQRAFSVRDRRGSARLRHRKPAWSPG